MKRITLIIVLEIFFPVRATKVANGLKQDFMRMNHKYNFKGKLDYILKVHKTVIKTQGRKEGLLRGCQMTKKSIHLLVEDHDRRGWIDLSGSGPKCKD